MQGGCRETKPTECRLMIRQGAQKLSEAVFCRPLNPQASRGTGCKKSLHLIFALLNFPSTENKRIPTQSMGTRGG